MINKILHMRGLTEIKMINDNLLASKQASKQASAWTTWMCSEDLELY